MPMDPSLFCLRTQAAGGLQGLSVQQAPGAPTLRPASSFPDGDFNLRGSRETRGDRAALHVTVKAQTPQGRHAAWPFEVSPLHTVREVKERLALFVSHRLWGGAYRVSG